MAAIGSAPLSPPGNLLHTNVAPLKRIEAQEWWSCKNVKNPVHSSEAFQVHLLVFFAGAALSNTY